LDIDSCRADRDLTESKLEKGFQEVTALGWRSGKKGPRTVHSFEKLINIIVLAYCKLIYFLSISSCIM
jgi:hypothetical protein